MFIHKYTMPRQFIWLQHVAYLNRLCTRQLALSFDYRDLHSITVHSSQLNLMQSVWILFYSFSGAIRCTEGCCTSTWGFASDNSITHSIRALYMTAGDVLANLCSENQTLGIAEAQMIRNSAHRSIDTRQLKPWGEKEKMTGLKYRH